MFINRNMVINLINSDTKPEVFEFFDNLSWHLFGPYILQPPRLLKKFRTLIHNIFINSIEFSSYPGSLTS